MVSDIDAGILKVRDEKFAYLTDETQFLVNEYRTCAMETIEDEFYPSGLGIAVPDDWPYKKYFDEV